MPDFNTKASTDLAEIVAFLWPGGRTVVLLGPLASDKTELMNMILSALPGRALRVANPLVSPLTTDRVLLQISGESMGDDNSEAIIRCIVAELGDSEPATLAIDDAQTLDAEMLAVLARLPGLKGEGGAGLNLVVASNPVWMRALPDAFGAAWRDPEHTMVVTLTTEEASYLPKVLLPSTILAAAVPRARGMHRVMVTAGCAAVLLLCAGAFALRRGINNELYRLPIGSVEAGPVPISAASPSADVPMPVAVKPQTEPELLASEPGPLKLPSDVVRSEPQDLQLRVEFSAFLDRAGKETASLAPGAREALFREYLDWRIRAGSESPHLDHPGSQN